MKFAKKFLNKIIFAFGVLTIISVSINVKPRSRYQHSNIREVDFKKRTEPTDWDNNSLFKLADHNVRCDPFSALQGFEYAQDTAEHKGSFYKFACVDVSESNQNPKIMEQHTKKEKVDNEFTRAIQFAAGSSHKNRQLVKCEEGYALQQFRFEGTKKQKNASYSYDCVKVNCGNVEEKETKYYSERKMPGNIPELGTKNLEPLRIQLLENQVLTGFQLNYKDDIKKFFYKYRFCTLKTKESKINPVAPKPVQTKKPVPNTPIVPPTPIKDFCNHFCDPNPNEILRNCAPNEETLKPCRRCQIKNTFNDVGVKNLCSLICDSLDQKTCEIYGYNQNLLKPADIAELKKYNLDIK